MVEQLKNLRKQICITMKPRCSGFPNNEGRDDILAELDKCIALAEANQKIADEIFEFRRALDSRCQALGWDGESGTAIDFILNLPDSHS